MTAKAQGWIVIVEDPDGSLSVTGPFADEYTATTWANENETEESGCFCHVRPIENPEDG